jgi:DNA-binding winged helix-turn-helix (wHTH) protein
VPFLFGDCTLDVERRELRRGAELIPVEPQVFDLLVYLLRNRDRVVTTCWRRSGAAASSLNRPEVAFQIKS